MFFSALLSKERRGRAQLSDSWAVKPLLRSSSAPRFVPVTLDLQRGVRVCTHSLEVLGDLFDKDVASVCLKVKFESKFWLGVANLLSSLKLSDDT